AVLVACALPGLADPPARAEPPRPLPEGVVKEWKAAGAKVGWVRLSDAGEVQFVPDEEGKPGDLPAVRFGELKLRAGAKVPAPEAAFGLDLGLTQLTDAGLKDLARLTNVRVMIFGAPKVTDAGVKELAALKGLQAVSLGGTQVTNGGLKHLAGLKDLRS